jgi:hypothetical protein
MKRKQKERKMKTKETLVVVTTALGTAVLTVVILGGGSLDAGNGADTPAAKIAKPKFVRQGVEMTLSAKGGATFKPGDQPEFELTAFNPTGKPASVSACVEMTAVSQPALTSRVVPMPATLCQMPESFTVEAGETKVFTIPSKTHLPPNQLIYVWLKDFDAPAKSSVAGTKSAVPTTKLILVQPFNGVMALSFSTATNAAPAASVASAR